MGFGGWVRRVAAIVVSMAGLLLGWRWTNLASGMMTPGMHEAPWRSGRSWREISEATPLTPLAWAAVLGVLIGLVVLGSRPRTGFALTFVGLCLYGAAGGWGPAMLVPGAVAAVALVRRLGWAATWPWLLAAPVAVWSTAWGEPWLGLSDPDTWSRITVVTMWMLAPTLIVTAVRGRRASLERSREEELRQVAHAERLRVARDIHDVVGHALSMISLQSAVALRVLDSDPAQARASLEAIRTSSKEALADVRETLGVFRAEGEITPLAPTPDLAAIRRLVDETRAGDVPITLGQLPASRGIGPATQAVAYRVAQEGITNAVRHAPGAAIQVEVTRAPGALVVSVSDDAPVTRPVVEGGGLRGMRERVDALGGTLAVTGSDSGFRVTATLPTDAERVAP